MCRRRTLHTLMTFISFCVCRRVTFSRSYRINYLLQINKRIELLHTIFLSRSLQVHSLLFHLIRVILRCGRRFKSPLTKTRPSAPLPPIVSARTRERSLWCTHPRQFPGFPSSNCGKTSREPNYLVPRNTALFCSCSPSMFRCPCRLRRPSDRMPYEKRCRERTDRRTS